MKLTLFVHDCFLEIGHSNAMIETLRNLPQDEIEKLTIVSFSCDDTKKLFPELTDKVKFHRIPFPFLKPILLKVIFYHLYTHIYDLLTPKTIRISIGIASLKADIINLQFVHHHWKDFFFKQRRLGFFSHIYKKILFHYFIRCEKKLFNKRTILFSSLSQYVTDYCLKRFNIQPSQIQTIYSAVNLDKYSLQNIERQDLYHLLAKKYPELGAIDPLKPIYLFIGAYERKGLPHALRAISALSDPQLIIVGQPEAKSNITFPKNISLAKILFTKELPLFYQLADTFVFPTHYEPYGLVISEAVAMGMRVYTTSENVGASEILKDINEVYLYSKPDDLKITTHTLLTFAEKQSLRKERIDKVFSKHSWARAGQEFSKICEKIIVE